MKVIFVKSEKYFFLPVLHGTMCNKVCGGTENSLTVFENRMLLRIFRS